MQTDKQEKLSAQMAALDDTRRAEMCVLGSAFRSPQRIADVESTLRPEHFATAKNAAIWRAMLHVFEKFGTIDPYTVGQRLVDEGLMPGEISSTDIVTLYDLVPTGVQIEHFAERILRFRRLSELSRIGTRLSEEAATYQREPDEIVSELEQTISNMHGKSSMPEIKPIQELLRDCRKAIDERKQQSRTGEVLSTGFVDIDLQIGGLRRGEMVIVAGRPGMGKSALGMNIAENASLYGEAKVLFVSLEMSGVNLAERILSHQANVNCCMIRAGNLSADSLTDIDDAIAAMGASKLMVAEIQRMTISKITSLCRKMKIRHGLDLVVIDYLQLLSSDDRSTPRHEQVADMSRRLKSLSVELDTRMIVLSQLNRNAESRGDNRPKLGDLRESGALEQDADVVMLVFRPEYYNPEDRPGVAEIDVAKQRNGPTGIVRVTFRGPVASFENASSDIQAFESVANAGGW